MPTAQAAYAAVSLDPCDEDSAFFSRLGHGACDSRSRPVRPGAARSTQLSARKACDIVLQLSEALHYIHKQGVVHCDIKLLDFGLARSLTASRASTSLSGTPHY